MIRLVSWNIRGMNASYKYREIRKFIDEPHLSFICLVENKVHWRNIDRIKRKCLPQWAFLHKCSMNRVGRVFVAWDPNVLDVSLICYTLQTITCSVQILYSQIQFVATRVYGYNDRVPRYQIWDDLVRGGFSQSGSSFLDPDGGF